MRILTQRLSKRAWLFSGILALFFSVAALAGGGLFAHERAISLMQPHLGGTFVQGQEIPITVINGFHVKIGVVKASAKKKKDPTKHIVGWIDEMQHPGMLKKATWNGWRTCDAKDLNICKVLPPGKYKIIVVTGDSDPAHTGAHYMPTFTDSNWDISKKAFTIKKSGMRAGNMINSEYSIYDENVGATILYKNVGDTFTVHNILEQNGVINYGYAWHWDSDHLDAKPSFSEFERVFTVKKQGTTKVAVSMKVTMADGSERDIRSDDIIVTTVPRSHVMSPKKEKAGKIKSSYTITNQNVSNRDMVTITNDAQWKVKEKPYFDFDYKLPKNANIAIGVQTNKGRYELLVNELLQEARVHPVGVMNLVKDNKWHHAKIDMFHMLGNQDVTIEEIVFEDMGNDVNNTYQYMLANFSEHIKNIAPRIRQGDHIVTTNAAKKKEKAGSINEYYKVTNLKTSNRDMITVSADAKYRPKDNPYLEFDYRIPADAKLSLGLFVPGKAYWLLAGKASQTPRMTPIGNLNLIQDNKWHHAKINIYDIIGQRDVEITHILFEDFENPADADYSYYLTNFSSFIENIDVKRRQGDHVVTKVVD